MDALFRRHSGRRGRRAGPYLFGGKELRRLLVRRAPRGPWRAARATRDDLDHTEAGGCLPGADPDAVVSEAIERGGDQCGTLGSGNHFLEVQVVERSSTQTPPGRSASRRAGSA